MDKPKFNIGDIVYWVDASTNYGKSVPCTMCFGKLKVTIILGDESKTDIECGACSHGFDRPSGTMKVWEAQSVIMRSEITGISKYEGGWRYSIGCTTKKEHELFPSKESAEPERQSRLKEVTEQARKFFVDSFRHTSQKQIWSAKYHQSCIKDAERQIEWHKLRLGMIEAKKP